MIWSRKTIEEQEPLWFYTLEPIHWGFLATHGFYLVKMSSQKKRGWRGKLLRKRRWKGKLWSKTLAKDSRMEIKHGDYTLYTLERLDTTNATVTEIKNFFKKRFTVDTGCSPPWTEISREEALLHLI